MRVNNYNKTDLSPEHLHSDKENIPLRMNYDLKRDKKFSYGHQSQRNMGTSGRKIGDK